MTSSQDAKGATANNPHLHAKFEICMKKADIVPRVRPGLESGGNNKSSGLRITSVDGTHSARGNFSMFAPALTGSAV